MFAAAVVNRSNANAFRLVMVRAGQVLSLQNSMC